MSFTPDLCRIPPMAAEQAQESALGLKWLAQSYAEAGMVRDSQWWLNHSISLAQTPPHDHT